MREICRHYVSTSADLQPAVVKNPTRLETCASATLFVHFRMMTSTQIRQSFLDFFKSKSHTIVPSSSLMPDSPNLLFTNAGMNQFVPIFLGQTKCLYTPGRAADTQKCIRAGGKHNDLDDVGLDTYHHTFFEMLGNWSFGDYFKKEAIEWAWELVVGIWKFPPQRLYATVYNPDKTKNDPSEFDQEAWNFWAEKFRSVGLDPAVHIVNGNKKDNFWMMGETGPCGPCSELHVDLTPAGDTRGSLVNKGDARCIEIWNLVFIQFNAQPVAAVCDRRGETETDRRSQTAATIEFVPLAQQHVDTGMGFERATSIIQGTKNFSDFANAKISNYETDIFRPIFDELEKLSGKKYGSTLPKSGSAGDTEQEKIDVAFRVIADHIRTLSFAIADGIQPGNTDRNYVLRRILRRAVRYGRTLGFKEPFFYKLVDVVAENFGDVFPEIRAKKKHVQDVIRIEEIAFNKTLDRGIEIFGEYVDIDAKLARLSSEALPIINRLLTRFPIKAKLEEGTIISVSGEIQAIYKTFELVEDWRVWGPVMTPEDDEMQWAAESFSDTAKELLQSDCSAARTVELGAKLEKELRAIQVGFESTQKLLGTIRGGAAFELYDTYGFPLDLTELMARERGLTVDKEGFEKLMEEQRARARAAQKKEVISLSQIETTTPTKFVGYDDLSVQAKVVEVVSLKDKTAVILDTSVCYAEMGGQVGDTGELTGSGQLWRVVNTQKSGNTFLHFVESGGDAPVAGSQIMLTVDKSRRDAIQRHHTVTHLLHWALHEVASKEASQKGSFVGPDKLTFDFNSAPLTPAQVADIEKLVNERILENARVFWTEVPHADIKNRKDIMQFFGDKYGDTVRVVQIGGHMTSLDGYSMELCGGTHTRATGEIGLFRIVSEAAVAAGVRRIEAVAGLTAYGLANEQLQLIRSIAGKINSPVGELEKKVEALLAHQKELEKSLKSAQQREAAGNAKDLVAKAETINGVPAVIVNLGANDGDTLQAIADALKAQFKGVVVLGGAANGMVTLIASVSADFTAKIQAGKIIQTIAPIVGGKGGGKPDNARGGGKDAAKLDEALAKAKSLLV
jgi:alanyl-tRNA synthetase